jgi:hypothetical protein
LDQPLADGWITRIEAWCKEFARDGQVAAHSREIAASIGWRNRRDLAVTLAECGFLLRDGTLHGWLHLNGWLIERGERERERERKRNRPYRSSQPRGDPAGPTHPPTHQPRSSTVFPEAHAGTDAIRKKREP